MLDRIHGRRSAFESNAVTEGVHDDQGTSGVVHKNAPPATQGPNPGVSCQDYAVDPHPDMGSKN